MRVLILADASVYHPYKWMKVLSSLGNDVKILTFEKPIKNPSVQTIRSYRIPKLKYILGISKVKSFVEKFNPDIVFPHFLPNYGLISVFTKKFKILALWGSDIMFWPFKTPLHKILAGKILRKFDIIVCDANVVKNILVDRFGIDEDRIRVIPFGVHKDVRERPLINLPRDRIRLVSLRRMESIFNHFEIINFVRMISGRFDVEVVYLNSGRLMEKIRNLSGDLPVKFMENLPFSKYVEILQTSHFCISIPDRDATSVSLLEAMSLGCVPIVSDIPANREWLSDDTAIISKPVGEEIFNNFVKKFNWNWWENARRKNKETINLRCNWEKNVEGFWKEVIALFNA